MKNKYVVTPDGKPIGGLPSGNEASDFEEGESQKANFTSTFFNRSCCCLSCFILYIQIFY
ncbi:MAG: hypothetical protein V9E96_19790 [Chitinophagaceae bacterium]